MPNSPLRIGFGVPFYEAIRAAQQRGVVLPDVYYGQLQGLARQHAFSIAGLASLDQLEQVKNSLSVGLQRGISFNKWKKEMLDKGILELPAHRLDNIFRTNIQGNYNRGRWEKIQRNKHRRPYLMYDAINDSRVRPTHLAMDGIIKPADDSFWNAHAPLNGYRCRCRLISLTEVQAQARSGRGKGLNKPIKLSEIKPDKGWDYNPGADLTKGIDKAIKTRPKSKIKDSLVNKVKNDDLLDGVILKGHTAKEEFVLALEKLHPDHRLLVSKLKKPISINSTNTDSPHYNPSMKRIVADTATRDGQTFRHEYGHHIDNVLSDGSLRYKSFELKDAWNKDRKRLGLVSRKSKFDAMKRLFDDLYDIEIKPTKYGYNQKKLVIKDIGLSGVSDIIDSLTRGGFQKEYGAYGHGASYFKHEANRYSEIFAQLFYLRSTKHWAYTKEKFPALTSKFISLIDEGLKNAT